MSDSCKFELSESLCSMITTLSLGHALEAKVGPHLVFAEGAFLPTDPLPEAHRWSSGAKAGVGGLSLVQK